MTQCPYPEIVTDELSGKTASNRLYLVWHEGYEAHKFEMANQTIKLANLVVEFETEISNVKELKRELDKQRARNRY